MVLVARSVLVAVICIVAVHCKDYFGFPEDNQEATSVNKNRIPLYVPERCPGNQLLYPGNQQSDWICDCGPGFIYYPTTDSCYAVLKQGPCTPGNHLVLTRPAYLPQCVRNPCVEGFAQYNGTCFELDKAGGPCKPMTEGGGIFGVNATTLELGCLVGYDFYSRKCPPGSRCYHNAAVSKTTV